MPFGQSSTGTSYLCCPRHHYRSSWCWLQAKKIHTVGTVVRTPTHDLFMWLPGFPHHGGWVPRVRVARETDPGRHHVVFYDQGLEVIQHHLSYTLVIVANTKTHPWLKGRGNRFYFLMWQWQDLGRACRILILVWPFGENIISCNRTCCLALTKVGFSKQEGCGKQILGRQSEFLPCS